MIAGVAILVYQWRLRRHFMERLDDVDRRQENAYRRAGLALLARAETAHEISVILIRVALAAFPREQAASLVGEDWRGFLK